MLTLIAIQAIQSQQSLELAWQEARAECRTKPYVRFTLHGGGMGVRSETRAILAQDGRTLISLRGERAASYFQGSGEFPMVVTLNSVEFFDGRSLTKYDSLTGKTEKSSAKSPLHDVYPALTTFWLDTRGPDWKVVSFEDYEETRGVHRRFTLLSKDRERLWKIEVRLRDGFVVSEWHEVANPGPVTPGAGQQGARPYNDGSYLDREPLELDWKPPTRTSIGG